MDADTTKTTWAPSLGADAELEAAIGARFDALMETWQSQATYLGIHVHDGRLADLSGAAKEADMAAEAALVSRLEGVDARRLSEPRCFERLVARAEVLRYTQTPGHNLSYLLGKVLLLRLRATEQVRLGEAFSLKAFHDALLYSGGLPISFHRRLLAGEGGGPTLPTGGSLS